MNRIRSIWSQLNPANKAGAVLIIASIPVWIIIAVCIVTGHPIP